MATWSVPVWLSPASVKAWLRLADTADDDLIEACCAAVEPQVQRARPEFWSAAGPPYVPDAEVYQAAVMLAAKVYRRRNSPGGLEAFSESVMYVSRFDPEVQRALHQGAWAMPGVG